MSTTTHPNERYHRELVKFNNRWPTGTLCAVWPGDRTAEAPVHLARTCGAAQLLGGVPMIALAGFPGGWIKLSHVEPIAEPALHVSSANLSAGPQQGDVAFARGELPVDEGAECDCSRCRKPITDVAVRLWSANLEWRYHVACLGLLEAAIPIAALSSSLPSPSGG